MKILNKIFGSSNSRQLKKMNRVVDLINGFEGSFETLSNEELCKKTIESSLANVKGIIKAIWNIESKIMEVQFDEHKITLNEIKQKNIYHYLLENFEKEYLTTQLKKFGGNISKTAEFVGMERSALHRKLKSLGIKGIN